MNQFTALLLTGLMLVSVSMIALSQQAMADNGKGGACVIGIGGPCNNNEKSNTGGGSHHSSHHHEGSSFSGNSISVQSKHGNRLIQIPSNVTDFTNEDNSSLILVSVHNTKDIVSPYDIKGVVENVSNNTLIGVWIIATLYDAKKNAIIERQSPATISGSADSNIEPGQSKPFDIPFLKPDLNGQATPVFFKLGFRWL